MKGNSPHEPVFILAGQSNMAGRCDSSTLPAEFFLDYSSSSSSSNNNATNNIYSGVEFRMCWDNDSNRPPGGNSEEQWRKLQPQPVPRVRTICFGPEFGIAAALGPRLYRQGVRRAHFIKFAMGGTNLSSNWNPDNPNAHGENEEEEDAGRIGHYHRFVAFCRRSFDSLETTTEEGAIKRLAGLFWLQGESDSSQEDTAHSYRSNFQNFANAIRNDLKCERLPIVVSPITWHDRFVPVVNEALREAGNGAVEGCICIDALDPSFGVKPSDAAFGPLHLTGAGATDIGRRMGEAMPLSLSD